MMREYTILLDPPVFMEQMAPMPEETSRPAAMESYRPSAAMPEPRSDSGFRPAVTGSAASVSAAARVPAPTSDVQAMPTQTYEPQPVPAYTRSVEPPGGYRIQPGDTLWSLADAMRPDQSVSIEQMMLAMLRTNPEAFINENINGLKKGYILRIPDRSDIVGTSHKDAVALVSEQHGLWREYMATVAGGTPAPAVDLDADSGEGAGIDDSLGDEGPGARLEIVAAGSGLSASSGKDPTQMSATELRAELARARETLETERLEKEALQQRVSALEGQVDRMKSLLTLEDADMAEMQQAVTPVEGEAGSEAALTEEIIAEEGIAAEEQELLVEEAALEDVSALEELAVEDTMAMEEAESLFADEEAAGEGQLGAVEEMTAEPVATAEDYAVTPPVFTQPKQQDPLSMLLNNPMLLAAAGGGLLMVLLLIALIMKRRSSRADEQMVASNLDDIETQLDESDVIKIADDEAVAEQLAETDEVSRAEAVAEPADAEPSMEDTVVNPPQAAADAEGETRDDVIAEADVYLAYGIYQQAEELLQNALKDNPEKDSYRVKLAETYLASKNSDAFVELATDMNQRRNGADTPAWQKIASIGQELVPGHALFTGASDGDLDVGGLTSPAAEAVDSGTGSDTDLDLGLDETVAAAEEAAPEMEGDLEFDLAETGAHEAVEEEAESGVEFDLTETQAFEPGQTTQEFSLDIEAAELGIDEEAEEDAGSEDEFDLDLSAEADALTVDDDAEAEDVSLDEISDELIGFDADEAGVSAETSEPEQLEEATILDFADAAAEAETSSGDMGDEDLDLSDLDDVDEVSTKLDLAKAYLDMGDADGTRSILDEVMSEGNDQQKKEADELLRQLG